MYTRSDILKEISILFKILAGNERNFVVIQRLFVFFPLYYLNF